MSVFRLFPILMGVLFSLEILEGKLPSNGVEDFYVCVKQNYQQGLRLGIQDVYRLAKDPFTQISLEHKEFTKSQLVLLSLFQPLSQDPNGLAYRVQFEAARDILEPLLECLVWLESDPDQIILPKGLCTSSLLFPVKDGIETFLREETSSAVKSKKEFIQKVLWAFLLENVTPEKWCELNFQAPIFKTIFEEKAAVFFRCWAKENCVVCDPIKALNLKIMSDGKEYDLKDVADMLNVSPLDLMYITKAYVQTPPGYRTFLCKTLFPKEEFWHPDYEYSDCVETTAFHLLNIVLLNHEEGNSSKLLIPENIPEETRDFFIFLEKDFDNNVQINPEEAHIRWIRLLQERSSFPLKFPFLFDEKVSKTDRSSKLIDLSGGFLNILKVLIHVMGITDEIIFKQIDEINKQASLTDTNENIGTDLEDKLKQIFKSVFTRINPTKEYTVFFRGLKRFLSGSKGDKTYDFSGWLILSLSKKDPDKELGRTVFMVTPGHGEVQDCSMCFF